MGTRQAPGGRPRSQADCLIMQFALGAAQFQRIASEKEASSLLARYTNISLAREIGKATHIA